VITSTPEILAFAKRCASRIRIRPSFVDQEDCVHDCYVAYVENVKNYPPDSPVPMVVWLFRRIVADVKRKYGRIRNGEPAEMDELPSPPICPDARLDREAAFEAVGFTPIERVVMDMRYSQGMTHQQIADQLGRTRPYITEVLSRAHDRIRCFYDEVDLLSDPVQPDGQRRTPSGPRRKRGRPAGARTEGGGGGDD